jgi:hypothetical protein
MPRLSPKPENWYAAEAEPGVATFDRNHEQQPDRLDELRSKISSFLNTLRKAAQKEAV